MLVGTLKTWTGKARATTVYDTNEDEFTMEAFNRHALRRKNIAVVVTTSEGDVFGFYTAGPVVKQHVRAYDPEMFVFSLESHGRCMTPQRFFARANAKKDAFVEFCERVDYSDEVDEEYVTKDFAKFGTDGSLNDGVVSFGDDRLPIFDFGLDKGIEGVGVNALIGTSLRCTTTRIVVIQFDDKRASLGCVRVDCWEGEWGQQLWNAGPCTRRGGRWSARGGWLEG